MKVIILILLIYSVFGLNIEYQIKQLGRVNVKLTTSQMLVIIAIILYCRMMWT